MNKWILSGAILLLTGCPGPMDPATLTLPAQAAVVDNRVCITVPAEEGEKVFSVQFGSDAGQEMYKTFGDADKQLKAVKGACLPTFGFAFQPANTYVVYYRLEKNPTEKGRLFAARFSLTQDNNGRLQIVQYQR